MSTEKDSYKQIFKATSIFGGIQVFNIIVSLVKSKVIAVILGPSGMGIIAIFLNSSNLLAGITNLGINVSAVKAIASSNKPDTPTKLQILISVFKKLIWLTASLGLMVTVILSSWLSKISFGNTSYTFSFMLIGVSLFALQLGTGQNSILQGMRQVKLVALSSFFGALTGLLISLPLYIFFKEKGIVPSIIATSFAGAVAAWYFLRKIKIPTIAVDLVTVKKEGNEMIKIGFLISLAYLFPVASGYAVRLFILRMGSIEDVGLYSAGFAIVVTYVGMVFAAMNIDYYPSLAAIAHERVKVNLKVNQQMLISILILAPILTLLVVFIKIGIIIIYSAKFLPIVKMIQWAALGVFFQACSWCIGFLFLAKGDSKAYFLNELIPNIYMIFLNCVCYYIWGLEGLGFSFLLSFIIYLIQVYIVAYKMYRFKFDKEILKICSFQFLITAFAFVIVYFLRPVFAYTIGSLLFILSSAVSLYVLDKKIGIKNYLLKRKKTIDI